MTTIPTANPDDIIVELESVADFIRGIFPDCTYYYQRIPAQPQQGDFSIRFQNTDNVQETPLTNVSTREWQIVYFGGKSDADVAEVLSKMNGINKLATDKRRVIPIKDSLRYMRIGSFSFGQPLKTEDDRHAIIGILTTEVRKARDLEAHEKIMRLAFRVIAKDGEGGEEVVYEKDKE